MNNICSSPLSSNRGADERILAAQLRWRTVCRHGHFRAPGCSTDPCVSHLGRTDCRVQQYRHDFAQRRTWKITRLQNDLERCRFQIPGCYSCFNNCGVFVVVSFDQAQRSSCEPYDRHFDQAQRSFVAVSRRHDSMSSMKRARMGHHHASNSAIVAISSQARSGEAVVFFLFAGEQWRRENDSHKQKLKLWLHMTRARSWRRARGSRAAA